MNSTDTNTFAEITIRCRAFDGEGVRANRLRVDSDGTVRVFDRTAGHFTLCHSLAPSAERRARKAAAAT